MGSAEFLLLLGSRTGLAWRMMAATETREIATPKHRDPMNMVVVAAAVAVVVVVVQVAVCIDRFVCGRG